MLQRQSACGALQISTWLRLMVGRARDYAEYLEREFPEGAVYNDHPGDPIADAHDLVVKLEMALCKRMVG